MAKEGSPPHIRLHKLKGSRKDFWSVTVKLPGRIRIMAGAQKVGLVRPTLPSYRFQQVALIRQPQGSNIFRRVF
jgi:hypothetical protein